MHWQSRSHRARVLIVIHKDSCPKTESGKHNNFMRVYGCQTRCKTWRDLSLSCPPSQLTIHNLEDSWKSTIACQDVLLTLVCAEQHSSFKESILHRLLAFSMLSGAMAIEILQVAHPWLVDQDHGSHTRNLDISSRSQVCGG